MGPTWGHDTELPTLTSRDVDPGWSVPPPFLVLLLARICGHIVTGGRAVLIAVGDGEGWRSFRRAWVMTARVAGAEGTGGRAGGCEDQARGGLGGVVGEVGQHAGVGVGGEHDAGVAQHRLYGFEVVGGGEGQAGRAVAQVVQPDRRQVGLADETVEQFAEPVGFDRVTAGVGEDEPSQLHWPISPLDLASSPPPDALQQGSDARFVMVLPRIVEPALLL